jgi:hypothetical protein
MQEISRKTESSGQDVGETPDPSSGELETTLEDSNKYLKIFDDQNGDQI